MTDTITELTEAQNKANRKVFDDLVHAHLGTRLRRRRRLLGMTQQSLADKLGIRFQQIQKYECAHNAMNIPRLMQICEATGVHPDFFFHGLPIWDRITKNTKVPDEELSIELVQLAMKIGRLSEKKRESLNAMIDTMLEEV